MLLEDEVRSEPIFWLMKSCSTEVTLELGYEEKLALIR